MLLIRVVTVITILFASVVSCAQETSSVKRAQDAAQKLVAGQKYNLQYKFDRDEEIRWKVEHVATTKTQMAGNSTSTSSRTKSTKLWKISSIDKLGNITFVHSVEDSDLWQKIGEEDPVFYNTKSKAEVPKEFSYAAEMVGKPLAILTISRSGKVVDRKSSFKQLDFGVGDICVPMPEKPIPVGHRWFVPTEFSATDPDGKRLQLKSRINYELNKVVDGQAYISFRTEILTPIENDQIRSQLLQKLSKGYVVFDIEKGRLSKKEIEWNEKVQEFSGPDSLLHYIGKMTEQIAETGKSSSTRRASNAGAKIKGPDDKPIIRK